VAYPSKAPTAEQRKLVQTMAAAGIQSEAICLVMGVSGKTLRKHYRAELDTALTRANAMVASSLYMKAIKGNVVARNICVGNWLKESWHATPGMLLLESNLTNANSSFVRPPGAPVRATDFAVRADSPVWKLGFQSIPTGKIGPYQDEFRGELPK